MFSQIKKKNNLAVFAIILFTFFAFQFTVKSQNETESFNLASPTETPHNLVGTYYNTRDFSAKFLLNNKGTQSITVYPTLYNPSGQSVQILPETVNANSHRLIDLNDWAMQGGESFKEGNIKIYHTGKDLVLGTQIYLEDLNKSISFDEKLAELTKFDTRKQEAVWWMPNRQTDVKIALSNTSDSVLSIDATLSRKPKKIGVTENFTLQPHQTRLLDLRNDFSDGSQFDNHEILGLSLTHAGAKDALLARIMLKNEAIGYSNVVQFSNPNTAKSNEYQGVGFHIDKLGGTQLEPKIVIKNIGTVDSNVQIKIPYTRNNGNTNTIILPIENLKAGEMKLVNANQITNIALQENIKVAGIEVSYDTPNGSVIVATHSVSPNRTQVYRVPMWDPFQQKSPTGGYPWRIEQTSTTKTYIKNITNSEQEYIASIVWGNQNVYTVGLKKALPHQSIEIDVKKIRDQQIPDFRGVIIPTDVTSGQIKWTLHQKQTTETPERNKLALVGRSEQIDVTNGISSNYACQNCCNGGDLSAYISTDPTGLTIPTNEFEYGDMVQYYAFVIHQDCYGNEMSCQVIPSDWDTNNSSIATIGDNTGLVTITGVGDVEIDADVDGYFSIVGIGCEPPGPLSFLKDGNECKEEIKEKNERMLAGCGECETNYLPLEPNANIKAKPQIKILRNGQDITSTPQNQNVQNVVVGEKISLTTQVTGGGTPTNKQWSVPETRIKDYQVVYTSPTAPTSATKIALNASDLQNTNVDFYWVDGADGREVTYSITVSGKTYFAKAKFNVKRPDVDVTADTGTRDVYLETRRQSQNVGFGGIVFTRLNFQLPTGFTGKTYWLQTVSYSNVKRASNGETRTASGTGLDSIFPYSSNDPNSSSTSDAPAVCLRVCNDSSFSFTTMTTNFNAEMWLIFKPDTSNSIYVPLKKVSWDWSSVSTQGSDFLFTLTSKSFSAYTPNTSIPYTTSFPEWNKLITGREPYQ